MIEVDERLRLEDEGDVTWLGFLKKKSLLLNLALAIRNKIMLSIMKMNYWRSIHCKHAKKKLCQLLRGRTVHCIVSNETIYQDINLSKENKCQSSDNMKTYVDREDT